MALRSEPYRNGSDSYLISIKPLPCSDEENKRAAVNEIGSTRYDAAYARTLPHVIARPASRRNLFACLRQSQETLKRMAVTRP